MKTMGKVWPMRQRYGILNITTDPDTSRIVFYCPWFKEAFGVMPVVTVADWPFHVPGWVPGNLLRKQ